MQNLDIFQLQEINKLLQENNIEYTIKACSSCGAEYSRISAYGKLVPLNEILSVINPFIRSEHIALVSVNKDEGIKNLYIVKVVS